MNPVIVTLADRCVGKADFRQITNDSLADLQDAIHRNTPPDCEKTIAEMTCQILEAATKALKDSNVFVACLNDKTELHFFGRVPIFHTPESISGQIFQKDFCKKVTS